MISLYLYKVIIMCRTQDSFGRGAPKLNSRMRCLILLISALAFVSGENTTEKCEIVTTEMNCRRAAEQDLPKTAYPDVTWLFIFNSKVPVIKAITLKNLPNLKDFNAMISGIEKVEDDAFKSLKQIRMIDLSYNKIKAISPNLVEGLIVDYFYISNNTGLTVPERKPFLKSDKIRWLDMAQCEITTVYSETFSSLPGLSDLSLARNKLKTLPEDIFKNNPAIISLDIRGNQIKMLSDQIFTNLGTIVAYFEDNPWVCDCHLAPLLLWSKKNAMQGEVKCAQPAGSEWTDMAKWDLCIK